MFLVVFIFVVGDVLFKKFLVYKGGELAREDSLVTIPSAVCLPVRLSCTYFCSSPQSLLWILSAVHYNIFPIIFLITFFPQRYCTKHIRVIVNIFLEEVVLCLCQTVKLCIHMLIKLCLSLIFIYPVYFQHNSGLL